MGERARDSIWQNNTELKYKYLRFVERFHFLRLLYFSNI